MAPRCRGVRAGSPSGPRNAQVPLKRLLTLISVQEMTIGFLLAGLRVAWSQSHQAGLLLNPFDVRHPGGLVLSMASCHDHSNAHVRPLCAHDRPQCRLLLCHRGTATSLKEPAFTFVVHTSVQHGLAVCTSCPHQPPR